MDKMNDDLLQAIAKSLTHLVYRNTIVEDLHAEGACLDDSTMKIINKEPKTVNKEKLVKTNKK